MATIAVDFDGTIHDFHNVPKGHKMGPPMPGAKQALDTLTQAHHNVVIFTVRGDHPYIRDWLKFYDIPYSRITNIKQQDFVVMIDDKGLRFTTWPAVMKQLGFK